MQGTSTIITVGWALNRAEQVGAPVRVLAGGEWITGRVASIDGHGVVLEVTDTEEYAVLRLETVTAIRIPMDLESRPAIQDATLARGA